MTTYSLADVRAVCKARDAWWTVLLVDPIACRLVRLVAGRTSITPNQVTAVAFVLGTCAAACFSVGSWGFLALGAVFYHLGFIADCVDGKLARLKGNGTSFGLWLDFSLDQVRLVMCSFALSYGIYQQTGRVEAAYLAAVIIAFDLFRYLNGPHMAKVRRAMRERLVAAMAEARETEPSAALRRLDRYAEEAQAEHVSADDHRHDPPAAAPVPGSGEHVELRVQAREGLQSGFRSRFPWYTRAREALLAHRIRTHLISGIEYQMAVFVIGPLLGPAAVPYAVAVAGGLLMLFESALVYKLWMSTRDFKRTMRRLTVKAEKAERRAAREQNRIDAPIIG
ncbi:CDP-alcohol phosphatidyltransferase family protein [Spongiactinospora sp. TRM90649]|uniref:CDP-alcohol phosphatidyltransferase family protein n=1 Tax=Spongiactinospora sp. TRM90649 TaxID=3031114 RepID=UPI0023F6B92F|nr:CDP-alcohol phosphatidyltransferase family protein [Spongiactinospora sp. TRM90649]MDF5751394.1 CDP-alcohol phosphatidyltransferase family protein [Spongiactinospora sp. TRM90649]